MQTGRNAVRLLVAAVLLLTSSGARASECQNGTFDSTFALIEKAIFENHGCTNSLCHGAAASGGLDLRPGLAYDNLIDVDAQSVPGRKRVVPGRREDSLLWINLAAKTFPQQWTAPLRPMPLDPVPALSADEVEALRVWIVKGAPRDGVIDGTAQLLDACLPPPEPVAIKPLPPPAPGEGVQLRMPRWVLNAHSEREVCFASYYDVTDQVPPALRRADGTFRYKSQETRQDPLSHHMVPILYEGSTPVTAPVWGAWHCRGGTTEGTVCNPLDASSCGGDGICATDPASTIGCIGYGPGDGGIGISSVGISITQQTAEEFRYAPGVYGTLPMKGLILWSSHAFNLTDQAGKLEAWLNFEFAAPDEQQDPAIQIFDADSIFKTNAPAFGTDEPCAVKVFPPNTHLFELTSHTHKRGKRWRTFLGAFRCDGGPGAGLACDPLGYDFASPDVCQGAPCTSTQRLKVGDCDLSGEVTVDEIVTGATIALGSQSVEQCHEADSNGDWAVSIDELVTSVNAALRGVPNREARDAHASLTYVSLIYNDPIVVRFNPPMVFPGEQSVMEDRAVTFCSLYDNGYTNPSDVKTRSGSPRPPVSFPGVGGPCSVPTGCTAGRVGQPCSGHNDRTRNSSCDTGPGTGDGLCDACPLIGGVTTEDEMFILLGQYYTP